MKSKYYPCAHCPLRKQYERSPQSLVGRFWRWQVNFCPVWGSYFRSLSPEEQAAATERYGLGKK